MKCVGVQVFPSMPENGTYNAMYNPKLEEYLLSNPADVLPEFASGLWCIRPHRVYRPWL